MDQATSPYPEAFLRRMESRLQNQFEAFVQALNENAPSSIRLNPRKASDRFQTEPEIPWCPLGRSLKVRPSFTSDPLFHAGAYYVQEASSMFLWYLLSQIADPNRPLRVLDLSAAPGGKTTLVQSFFSTEALIVANEPIGSRNKILRQNLTRWGCDNVIITQNDPAAFQSLPEYFDMLLIDAPCSGEGLFRKEPSAIQEWSESHLNHCARRQKRILHDALPCLRPGGILIYSTCTFNEAENEAHLEDLIAEDRFEPMDIDLPSTFGFVKSEKSPSCFYAYPHLCRGEGFFIGALRKPHRSSTAQPLRHSKRLPAIFKTASAEDTSWLDETTGYTFFDRGDHRIAMPTPFLNDYLSLSKALYITGSGLNMGRIYHGQLRPSPELALSFNLSSRIPRIDLDRSQAQRYLSHQNLLLPDIATTGWHLASHDNLGMGWINVLKNGQIKNAYPTAWRILRPDRLRS